MKNKNSISLMLEFTSLVRSWPASPRDVLIPSLAGDYSLALVLNSVLVNSHPNSSTVSTLPASHLHATVSFYLCSWAKLALPSN